jgi:hypothetical protein
MLQRGESHSLAREDWERGKGADCTYVTSLHEGEGLAAEEGIAVGGVGVLLPEIAG